ncbi:MAG: hypothetical protein KCHDKBKB_02248 [Elusimicrobia bacterium]|nr:hypothetical protein [Elusimicrobiota bacterium]
MLKQASQLKARLDGDPSLSRADLARQVGVDPSYLTRLLNLVKLAPGIQEYILTLPPSKTKGPITESRLKEIARVPDHQVQLERFDEIKQKPARGQDYGRIAFSK